MPIAIRATAYWKTRRWLRSRYLSIRYDARFADGREEHDVNLDAVLQGSRYPADYWSTKNGAKGPNAGPGLIGDGLAVHSSSVVSSASLMFSRSHWVESGSRRSVAVRREERVPERT